ncbi:hypothetical protein MBLNU230_g3987t1 [Neophaeotheca triangularis]
MTPRSSTQQNRQQAPGQSYFKPPPTTYRNEPQYYTQLSQQQQQYQPQAQSHTPQPTTASAPYPSPDSSASPPSDTQTSTPTRPPKGHYICLHPQCKGIAFSRAADLDRHDDSAHNPQRQLWDCTVPGCRRVGANGLPRRDKLLEHLRETHKMDVPKREAGAKRKGVGRESW